MNKTVMLSDAEIKKMKSALGLHKEPKSYRNYFFAGIDDEPIWDGLVRKGFATCRGTFGTQWPCYQVTPAGIASLPPNKEEG